MSVVGSVLHTQSFSVQNNAYHPCDDILEEHDLKIVLSKNTIKQALLKFTFTDKMRFACDLRVCCLN